MGTIAGTTILNDAAFLLQDTTNVQWTRPELLIYLNDGQRDLVQIKPDAYTINQSQLLVAGTKQSLPANGAAFVRLVVNLGTNGTTPGRVPRKVDLEQINNENPNWHYQTASPAVLEYVYDERDPKNFYVSPPQPATGMGHVGMVYFAVPADLTVEADTITLDDIYKTALFHYVCYRAYLKEGELSNATSAAAHRSEFLALLGAKEKGESTAQGGR